MISNGTTQSSTSKQRAKSPVQAKLVQVVGDKHSQVREPGVVTDMLVRMELSGFLYLPMTLKFFRNSRGSEVDLPVSLVRALINVTLCELLCEPLSEGFASLSFLSSSDPAKAAI
jgi:hypothetical protein